MPYNGIFGCHENMCYVILINAFLCKVHITGTINVCTIFRTIDTKLTNLENMQKSYVYLMSRTQKRYVMAQPVV